MKFTCLAYDRAGRLQNESVEAADAFEAADQLRRRGLYVSRVQAERTAAPAAARKVRKVGTGRGRAGRGGKGRRLRDLAVFTRQMSVLVATGTPVVDALESIERQVPPGAWRDTIMDVRKRVEEGSMLSDALAVHPKSFDAVCRSLVAAGESGGRLDVMLDRLARLTRQQLKLRSNIIGAMVYPSLLVCVSVGVLTVMIAFVLPRFQGLFSSLGAPLPPSTAFLMDVSGFLREYWYAVLAALVGAGVGLKLWLRTPGGRRAVDDVFVRAPQLGAATRAFATARIARVLGVLLEGKVAILDALRLTRESTGNHHYADLIARAEEAVTRGETVSSAFASSPLVNPSVCEALRSGEKTGQVAPVLLSIADFMDEDNDVLVKSLTSILEPLILIVLGGIVGMVVLSMFLPLFDLTAATQQSGGGAP